MTDPVRAAVARSQDHLQAIYDVAVPARARDFLMGDAELDALQEQGLMQAHRRPDEQLLVWQEREELSLGLYLSDALRERIAGTMGLAEHCHVTEGVSHFLLVLWSAAEGRSVRPVDLELQAEIDKATTVLLLDHQRRGGRGAEQLLVRLFQRPQWLPGLDAEEQQRYAEANRLAERFARRLAALLRRGVEHLLAELRAWYRLGWDDRRARCAA